MSFQRTVRKSVVCEGVGLHSGEPVRITVSPAGANSGITFYSRRHNVAVPATAEHVVDSNFATTLGLNGARVHTVEHLMAAAAGLRLDNLWIEVDGSEVPAADGSADPFVSLLRAAGRRRLPARRKPIVIREPVHVGSGGRWLQIVPSETLRISYTLDNSHPTIGTQAIAFEVTEDIFVEAVAPARTYGFLRDVPSLRARGLARGGSLENAVVLGKRGSLNELRFSDEFVRHKALDLIGDLALLGRPLVGHVIARNGGHSLNYELVSTLTDRFGLVREPLTSPRAAPVLATFPTAAAV